MGQNLGLKPPLDSCTCMFDPLKTNGIVHKVFFTVKPGLSIVFIEGSWVIILKKNIIILFLMIIFVLANNAGPDKMLHATLCNISSGSSLFAKVPI